METKPYESRPAEQLPMGWSDGRTVPATSTQPPAFAAAAPPRSRRGLLVASIVGGLVVGGIALALALHFMHASGSGSEAQPAAVAAAPPTEASAAGSPKDAPPAAAADASPCPDAMAFVPGGKFFMGTDADDPVLQTARPAHSVEVGAFCIDIDEVTVDQYRECSKTGECKRAYRDSTWPQGKTEESDWRKQMEAHAELCNESYDDRGDHPINCVDWEQARAFCKRRGGDLPTEAQWEFAARGSDGRVYSWGDDVPTAEHMNGAGTEFVAWRESKGLSTHPVLYETDDGFVGTSPVGRFEKGTTQYGLHDIAGNVFEWTLDEFRSYESAASETAEAGPRKRVIRGGAFNSFQPQFADPALRFPQVEDAHNHGIGFRCVAEPSDAGE